MIGKLYTYARPFSSSLKVLAILGIVAGSVKAALTQLERSVGDVMELHLRICIPTTDTATQVLLLLTLICILAVLTEA